LLTGSGKSSLSKWVILNHPSFQRLSIDSYIYTEHGLYSIDYPKDQYNNYQEEAESTLRNELARILRQGSQDVILDFSFPFKKSREEWKHLVEESGGRSVLAYLDVGIDELRRRVRARNQLTVKDGDSAFFVTNEIFESFIAGFERPIGEDEVILSLHGNLNAGIDV
jgi:predicted kinase